MGIDELDGIDVMATDPYADGTGPGADAYSPIPELNLLKEFDDGLQGAGFSEGFEFYAYDWQDAGLVEWLGLSKLRDRDPERLRFLSDLIPFAQATGSGSFYTLWRCDDRADLATLPVVRWGDEGDLDVVACGLRDLFRLLALDSEWYLDADQVEEHCGGHEAYLAWLERTFGLTAPESPDPVTEAAEDAYGARFLRWLIPHMPEDIAESYREDLAALEAGR
ncbi:hypothetical protein [Streptomyces odontomachi]|uniref:hypothetical protein n=1 Tax=Streptomyces odontomachi TaxID=2944940 RepID=UPI00210D3889|nr:hypothetical protein [Streptomyces sp. ODS25]